VLGDSRGNLVHLGERECSIQRRHQKIIEEAPSPAVDADLRRQMGEAALSLAKAIDYRNAGTVEFLLDGEGRFFFMEMNTRLQVEHPVTERAWAVDIVEQQLLDASGEALRVDERDAPYVHAIEARLYAEDPANDFLPSTGVLVRWDQEADPWIDLHSSVDEGSVITTSFDPLIAKVVVEAPTREEAAKALALGLERMTIQGVTTNRDLLVAILRNESFLSGDTATDFLERVDLLARRELSVDEREAVLAAVVLSAEVEARAAARVLKTFPAGWRNSRMPAQRRILVLGEEETTVEYERARDGSVTVLGRPARLGPETIELDGRAVPIEVNRAGDAWWVHGPWGDVAVAERSPFPSSAIEEVSGSLHAPMPGSVVSVEVSVGDSVRKGQTLVVLEAMKMEHPIGCPEDGVVSEVKVAAGDQVERGALLVVVE
jgi:propionyl-CoA carboxylase alpha chain